MELTAENVITVGMDLAYLPEELPPTPEGGWTLENMPEGTVIADGIVQTFGFHPERLKARREDILSMLGQLPDQFYADKGGGWSFLNMAIRKDDVQWGEHLHCGVLCALGQAIGCLRFALPREFWAMLPGGVPYVSIDLDGFPENATPETPVPADADSGVPVR